MINFPTLTVSKGCPTTREASPPIPPASKFAPGEARSLSRVVLWDELGGDAVVVLVADDDLEGDKVLLLSLVGLVAWLTVVLACARLAMVTLELAMATFISRTAGCVGDSEQGQAP